MLAVNLYYIDLFWIHLLPTIVEDGVSRQFSIDIFRYDLIHLHPATVKEDGVSRQSSIDPFKNGWIHLLSAGVKEDSVSHQSNIDL